MPRTCMTTKKCEQRKSKQHTTLTSIHNPIIPVWLTCMVVNKKWCHAAKWHSFDVWMFYILQRLITFIKGMCCQVPLKAFEFVYMALHCWSLFNWSLLFAALHHGKTVRSEVRCLAPLYRAIFQWRKLHQHLPQNFPHRWTSPWDRTPDPWTHSSTIPSPQHSGARGSHRGRS